MILLISVLKLILLIVHFMIRVLHLIGFGVMLLLIRISRRNSKTYESLREYLETQADWLDRIG